MLRRLTVENYALIDRLEMDLSPSLNIITGETGAGKSILLGALGLLLGNRAESGVIKDSDRNCTVEGVFDIAGYNLQGFFEDNDLDYEDHTIVRRTINSSGKSRAYINDLPVQLATLKEFVSGLIDIHSQHQTLMIADEGFRLRVVDSVAANDKLRKEYSELYNSLKISEKDLARMIDERTVAERDREWLTHQVSELQGAKLKAGEQAELESELRELTNIDDIKTALGGGSEALGADETGVLTTLKTLIHNLERVKDVYGRAEEIAQRINSAYLELKDVENEISVVVEKMDSDPERLETVESRLNLLYSLEQKHRVSEEAELIEVYKKYSAKLESITNGDDAIAELRKQVEKLTTKAMEVADRLTISRNKAAKEIKSYSESMLAELGIGNGVIEFRIEPSAHLKPSGHDDIKIMFSANKNMPLQAIEKSASGGELSRVMLAIKSKVAQSSQLPTIIFDEIDTGVSGQIADKMGGIIGELSGNMQVINITHLPQVASKGDTHWLVYKDNSGHTTTTHVDRLSDEDRILEIAKMLSGSAISDAAIQQAKLLLGV